MKTVITLVCCACSSLLLAQGWNKVYTPGNPNEIRETANQQYLSLYNDTSLMLLDHLGDTLWHKHFKDTYRDIRIANDSQLLRLNTSYSPDNNIIAEVELVNFSNENKWKNSFKKLGLYFKTVSYLSINFW